MRASTAHNPYCKPSFRRDFFSLEVEVLLIRNYIYFKFYLRIKISLILNKLGKDYETDIKRNAVRLVTQNKRSGRIEQDSYKLSSSKNLIDQIDLKIGQFLDLSELEIDFIINYDIKYRMGGADEEE